MPLAHGLLALARRRSLTLRLSCMCLCMSVSNYCFSLGCMAIVSSSSMCVCWGSESNSQLPQGCASSRVLGQAGLVLAWG